MGFDLPRVTKCCFCFSLRTGVLIIGYISILSVLLAMASTSFFIFLVSVYVKNHNNNTTEGHTAEDIASEAVKLYIVHGLQLMVHVCYFTISVMLVVGAHKSKPSLMRYYFYTGVGNLLLNLIITSLAFAFMGFFGALSQLISCAFMFYFLIVIRSAYIEIEEQSRPKNYEMSLYSRQQAPLMV